MTLKEFENLKVGDIVRTSKKKAEIKNLGYTLAEIEYLDTHRRVWKSSWQIHLIKED